LILLATKVGTVCAIHRQKDLKRKQTDQDETTMNTRAKATTTAAALLLALFAGLAGCAAEPGDERIDQTVVSAPVNQAHTLNKAFRADADAAVKATQISICDELAAKPQMNNEIRVADLTSNQAG
jgi:hypothetical protein